MSVKDKTAGNTIPTSIPNPEALKKQIAELQTQENSEVVKSTTPSIAIIGCGGCGTNLVKNIKVHDKYEHHVTKRVVDTSLSNIRDLGSIELEIIKSNDQAIGSGKIRKTNAKEIQQSISQLKVIKDSKDITIVIHSASGGSGSVIGPLIVRQLAIMKKAVVVILVSDATCKMSTTNTINTINSYKRMCVDENLYIPVFPVSNISGKAIADSEVSFFLNEFIYAMVSERIEDTDLLNKLNFLRPNVINEENIGLYEIKMFKSKSTLEDHRTEVHALMLINETGDPNGIKIPNAIIVYTGKLRTDGQKINPDDILVFTIGSEINSDLIEYLETKLEHYMGLSVGNGSATTHIGRNKGIGSSDKSGLIL